MSTETIISTKNALMASLGENTSKYLANMKLWFRNKWTKEEFDYESRKFLTTDTMHLHNQFLIAILNKIDTFQMPQPASPVNVSQANLTPSSNRSRKRKRTRITERVVFEPYDILDFITEDNIELIRPADRYNADENAQILPTQRYCANELFLPDGGFVLGRFLIGAWEVGLVTVEDTVAEYISMAVQVLLKNLISAIIMKRKHYKITGEGSFYYDIGAPFRDPSVRNTVTRQKVDDTPLELDKEITSPNFMRRSNEEGTFLSACEELYPQTNDLITLRDAQIALNDRNLIASHSVYAINMERLTQIMH